MRQLVLVIIKVVLFLFAPFITIAQPSSYLDSLARAAKMTVKIPAEFDVQEGGRLSSGHNAYGLYPYEINLHEDLPTLQELYDEKERLTGPRFFNARFGMVDAILYNREKDYYVFVYIKDKSLTMINGIPDLTAVKTNFFYGLRNNGATKYENPYLWELVNKYSKREARRQFGASLMYSYPTNLCGNSYRDKYEYSRTVWGNEPGSGRITLVFLMTRKNQDRFEEFLYDLKRAFRFDERK